MNDFILAIIPLVGAFVIAYLTAYFNRRKTDADISAIYTRLGLDKKKVDAENANTWMDVARKAADEYERVMDENVNLKRQISSLYKQNDAMQRRIRSLEMKMKMKKRQRG